MQNTEKVEDDQNTTPEVVVAKSCDLKTNEQPTEDSKQDTVADTNGQTQPKSDENGSNCCQNNKPSPNLSCINVENQENTVNKGQTANENTVNSVQVTNGNTVNNGQAANEVAVNNQTNEQQEKLGPVSDFDMIPLRTTEKKTLDFRHKTYLAPLTTVSLLHNK